MGTFSSNDDYFSFVEAFILDLHTQGYAKAAEELQDGYGCLNGLTDGWMQFLESIDSAKSKNISAFKGKNRRILRKIKSQAVAVLERR